jgi:hypothetical protein
MALFNKLCYLAAGGLFLLIAMNMSTPKATQPPTYEEGNDYQGSASLGNTQTLNGTTEDRNASPPDPNDPNNPQNQDPGPGGNGTFNSQDARRLAGQDNAPVGWCARGVANIAEAQGLGNFRGLDAHDFPSRMASQGYVLDTSYNQYNAPEGSMIIYNSDVKLGRPSRGTGGGLYGHVEMVTYDSAGNRGYTSSHTSSRPGGSVNDNFMGVWVKKN